MCTIVFLSSGRSRARISHTRSINPRGSAFKISGRQGGTSQDFCRLTILKTLANRKGVVCARFDYTKRKKYILGTQDGSLHDNCKLFAPFGKIGAYILPDIE